MKKIIFALAAVTFTATSFAQTANPTKQMPATPTVKVAPAQTAPVTTAPVVNDGKGPQMKFETINLDYGTIKKGGEPNREFAFKNTGKAPLIIANAQGSCGCTIPTWPKEPILPGKKSAIKVHYDTQRVGAFTKTITLTTNAIGQEKLVLTIHGIVEADPNEAAPVRDMPPHDMPKKEVAAPAQH